MTQLQRQRKLSDGSYPLSTGKDWKMLIIILALCVLVLRERLVKIDITALTEAPKKHIDKVVMSTMNNIPTTTKRTASEELRKKYNLLCPNKVPNMDVTTQVFQIAQDIFYKANPPMDKVPYNDTLTKKYFSHWPGHVSYIEKSTGRQAAFLRTWKCGSWSLQHYLKKNADHFAGKVKYLASLTYDDFPKGLQQQSSSSPDCIVSSFRDPISHFISGMGEIEIRLHWERTPKTPQQNRFKKHPMVSEERFVAFIDFMLRYEWDPVHVFRHVFPQSGHLYTLSSSNQTITRFISMKNLAEEVQDSLKTTCGIDSAIQPPKDKSLHKKVEGLDDFYRELWTNATIGEASPQATAAFEVICLLDAVDYACLESELPAPPPEFCIDVYERYLRIKTVFKPDVVFLDQKFFDIRP